MAIRGEPAGTRAGSGADGIYHVQCRWRGKVSSLNSVALTEDRLGHYERAEAAFRQALELDRHLAFPDPQIALAYVDFLKRDSREDDAGKLVSEILTWSPSNGTAHLYRANSFSRAGRSEQAVAEAQLALQGPDADLKLQRAAHALLARTYSESGREDQAKVHVDWLSAH